MSCELKGSKKTLQFDIVNTTSVSQSLNLFELGSLTTIPTTLTFSNNPLTQFAILVVTAPTDAIHNPTNGDYFIASNTTGNVLAYDLNDNLIATIVTGGSGGSTSISYCSVNNSIYVTNQGANTIFVINCSTYTLTTTIAGFIASPTSIVYNSIKNTMYVGLSGSSNISEIDCTTNTILGTYATPTLVNKITFCPVDNSLYMTQGTGTNFYEFNCVTNTTISTTSVPSGLTNDIIYVSSDDTIYIASNTSHSVYIYDRNTLILQNTINTGGGTTPFSLTYDSNSNYVFVGYIGTFNVSVINASTQTIINDIVSSANNLTLSYDSFTDTFISTSASLNRVLRYTVSGIASTPIYISGSVDYNFFIQNLEYSPIKICGLKFISNNQSQLSNVVTIKKIDADGNEKQNPEFPIIDVSAYQKQGSRANIPVEGLILDGRTIFSSYVINAKETVVLEICYEQLNRFCFGQHPELFTSLKPIAKEEKEKIENRIIERDKQESGDSESKFEIIKDSLVIDISVTNNTANTSTFNFFQANQNQLILNTPSVNFADVDAYNFLVQQLRDSPLVLNAVEVVSSDQNQLTLPISVTTDDANGDSITYQHFPINKVATGQQQGNRVIVKTNHLILDGYTTFASYNIFPNTTISFVLYYKQFNRSLFLKKHFYTQLKKPIFTNGMGFAEELEYFNEITENAKNKNSLKNNSKIKEKNSNFGTEQVYSVGFNGERTANPFLSITKNKVVDKSKPINQEKYNYRDVKKNNHDENTYKKNIY
jgi:YVTN family beta-propeller protein